jgi:hypothetical protein
MTIYEQELQRLRPDDFINQTYADSEHRLLGYDFISTAGHGYLIVPVNDRNAAIARRICKYGYKGKLAIYLEEDCEIGEFLQAVKSGQLDLFPGA